MAKTPTPRDAVSVVIPVHNAGERVEKAIPVWGDALARLGRIYEIVVVDDGSIDATAAALEKLTAGRVKHLRILKHDNQRGFGACLKTALATIDHPLLFYTSLDYPYTPADLWKCLERIEVRDEVFGKQPDLISGCRTGRDLPDILYLLGISWRFFWRVTCGMYLEPQLAWQGMREYLYGSFVGWVFGVPLTDVNSAFKLYRTSFLKRFPIQSDGDFVHTELVAKATFLTSIMDELPLTRTEPVESRASSLWREMWHMLMHPEFGFASLQNADKQAPPESPPNPGMPAPVT